MIGVGNSPDHQNIGGEVRHKLQGTETAQQHRMTEHVQKPQAQLHCLTQTNLRVTTQSKNKVKNNNTKFSRQPNFMIFKGRYFMTLTFNDFLFKLSKFFQIAKNANNWCCENFYNKAAELTIKFKLPLDCILEA